MEKVTEQQQEEEYFAYPVPEDCYATWKRWLPEDHYHRLFDPSDKEARMHLLNLILCRLKKEYYDTSVLKTGTTRDDLAHEIWAGVVEKIRDGRLDMRFPSAFYGLLKRIIANDIVNNFRRNGWDGVGRFGDMILRRFSPVNEGKEIDECQLRELRDFHDVEMSTHHRYVLQQVLLALAKEAPMKELERKALTLSILIKMGQSELSNNEDIAVALSVDTGEEITYGKASSLICKGLEAFKAYLDRKKIDWRIFES